MAKELLFSVTKKQLKIEYFSGTGAGGQYRNRHPNCARIRHMESGAIATGQSHRERPANLKEAFNNLVKHPKFKLWHNQMVVECVTGKSIDERVQEAMKPENLSIESKDENNKWIPMINTGEIEWHDENKA